MSFPTTLDDLSTTRASNDTTKLFTPNHRVHHLNEDSAIQALEAKVGINASAVTTSHDYKLSGVTGTDKAVSKTGTETLTNKTLTSPVVNSPTGIEKGDVGLGNVDNTSDATKNSAAVNITNKTLTSPKINEDVALTSTATELNLLHEVLGAWTTYNPTWTGLTKGNATVACKYLKIGRLVVYTGDVIWGNTTSASGRWIPSFPFAMAGAEPIGYAEFVDTGAAVYTGLIRGTYDFIKHDGVEVTNTSPFTWTTGDNIKWMCIYEATS